MDALNTQDVSYTRRLVRLESIWWKRLLDVQAPYRWHVRQLGLGFVLDIGCGVGRHLGHLGGNGVGIDHNPHSIATARERGLRAYLPEEFVASEFNQPARFDSLLLSHVAEHLLPAATEELLRQYLPLIKAGGRIVLICPQECGYRSDPTHVQFMDFIQLTALVRRLGLVPVKAYSFPLPRIVGRIFRHNEFVIVAQKPI
ncbi:MAG: hypothetical protein PCFJNLEI_00718 [Verrucomicrobiae bacterium]|nr:hypothetical protein [Verrucomicrobiae bacterium]